MIHALKNNNCTLSVVSKSPLGGTPPPSPSEGGWGGGSAAVHFLVAVCALTWTWVSRVDHSTTKTPTWAWCPGVLHKRRLSTGFEPRTEGKNYLRCATETPHYEAVGGGIWHLCCIVKLEKDKRFPSWLEHMTLELITTHSRHCIIRTWQYN